MRSRRIAGTVVGLSACLALAGCSSSGEPSTPATVAPTPIAKLVVGSIRLARAEFCDGLPAAAVRDALGADAESDDAWTNGDPAPGSASGEVAHEIGCAWTAADGTRASAWMFARPVDAPFAASIIGAAGRGKGCSSDLATVFGNPAMLEACPLPGGVERLRRAGLFGDTWLTCEVTGSTSVPEKARRARLDSWCAQVVAALRTS